MRDLRVFVPSTVLSIVVALGAIGCTDVARQAPSSAANAPATRPPRVTVSPETQDVGVVGLGEEAVGEVLVRNAGGASLTLDVPLVPRGTRVEGVVPELKPGASVRLRFVVDTFEAEGNRQQAWTLVTNDPDRPRVAVRLEVDVRPFLVARPGYARYITVQHAREGTITQTIAATDGATFNVLRVESPVPALRMSFREAMPDERQPSWVGSQWRVMSTLASDAPVGVLSGYIAVHTDHPRQKRALIPLSGFVRPIVAVTPSEARLGDLPRTRSNARYLFVQNFAEEAMEVSDVSADVAAVRVEIEPLERGWTWRLKLVPAPDAPLGPFEGKILLRTGSPNLPRLEIPLSGRLVD
jgi:copper(I)-binding protein